ncbi:MAG: DUF3137 domain-containing protein [Candidatus Gastranaerophilaceae bacterium]|nr:DUF3137 domain-containing protein [Candidatus Gastranaerophilaceae bacterium]
MTGSIEEFRRNFYNNYHNYLVGALEEFENKRKSKLIKAIVISVILILSGVILGYIELKYSSKPDGRLEFILIALGFGTYHTIKKNFEKDIKNKIMTSVCRCFNEFITWSQSYNNHTEFVNSGAIPKFADAEVDDVFNGIYKNVRISVVEAEYSIGSGKNRRTTFKGVIIKLNMNKKFSGHTIVCNDSIMHNSPVKELKRTELEDVEFEKKYDVFTNDPVEARYILNPRFMEKIKNIKVAFKCNKIKCAFHNNNLIISMDTGNTDLFSIGSLVKPVADPKQFEELMSQFISILALIDILELDKKALL